ncbi:MAG: RnfABCDGE type electron transport complex subunit D [Ruminococcus sp.]|nr:RnfABCDGE type electron transport complex subunit D [Candidatus Apopatosoma intestinale]
MMSLWNVSISPHIRSRETTASIMRDVIIALIPALGMGFYVFGWRAALITAISVASCVLTEFTYEKLMKLPVTVGDLSAVVTGLILAVNLYATAPWWIPLFGGVFAILVVKMLFGGIGQNFMNPALAARCFLLISFSRIMTDYPTLDGVSSATPFQVLSESGEEAVDLLDMLIGTHSGTIGETSAVAILIGALYLFIRKIISPRAPVTVILSTVAFVALFSFLQGDPVTLKLLAIHAMGGGLLVGAVFMASDYATTPVTFWGQIVFGVCVGFLTAAIRSFSGSGEGMSYAILIANLLTPVIEKLTYPKPTGARKERKA